MTTATAFATVADVIDQHIMPALRPLLTEDHDRDFVTTGIAADITEYREGVLVITATNDEFWAAVARHEI